MSRVIIMVLYIIAKLKHLKGSSTIEWIKLKTVGYYIEQENR